MLSVDTEIQEIFRSCFSVFLSNKEYYFILRNWNLFFALSPNFNLKAKVHPARDRSSRPWTREVRRAFSVSLEHLDRLPLNQRWVLTRGDCRSKYGRSIDHMTRRRKSLQSRQPPRSISLPTLVIPASLPWKNSHKRRRRGDNRDNSSFISDQRKSGEWKRNPQQLAAEVITITKESTETLAHYSECPFFQATSSSKHFSLKMNTCRNHSKKWSLRPLFLLENID